MISTLAPRARRAPKRHRMAIFGLLALAIPTLLAAAPADAAPDRRPRKVRVAMCDTDFCGTPQATCACGNDRGYDRRRDRGHDHGHNNGHDHGRDRWREVQYDKGYDAGQSAGYREGFQDGRWRRPYCDQPTSRLRGYPRPFVRGFRAAYNEAYSEGFERGKRRYRHRRPIKRRIWWRW